MRAYLFPGQGAEQAGMGRDYYANDTLFRDVIDQADAVLQFDLPAYLFGDAPLIDHPDWLQPATVAYQVALYRTLSRTVGPAAVLCGLSLGEYGAVIASGMMTLADGLRVVAKRGAAMAQAAHRLPGGMMAIRTDDPDVLALIEEIPEVWVANHNSAKQVVIGGTKVGLLQASAYLSSHGVRSLSLPVAGAFHTPLMAGAQSELQSALAATVVHAAAVPVLSTTTINEFQVSTLREVLTQQIVSPTNFKSAAAALRDGGITSYVELGVKPVLTKLVKQVDANADAMIAPSANTEVKG